MSILVTQLHMRHCQQKRSGQAMKMKAMTNLSKNKLTKLRAIPSQFKKCVNCVKEECKSNLDLFAYRYQVSLKNVLIFFHV